MAVRKLDKIESDITDIWDKYEKGKDYHNRIGLVDRTDQAHRFFIGDQWHGLESDGEPMPQFNFIKGIVRYKTAVVAQHTMEATFTPFEPSDANNKACELLNQYVRRCWELGKMDRKAWSLVKNACIAGDHYIYFPSGDVTKSQLIDTTNIFLADEQNADLQAQAYIIIRERRPVLDIRADAEKEGLNKDDISKIVSDEETDKNIGNREEVKDEDGKCTSLVYFYKDKEGFVHVSRSTRQVIYRKDKILKPTDPLGEDVKFGLKTYPIANFVWDEEKGSARGCGDVRWMIPNQITVNKTLARREAAVKMYAFPRIAYDGVAVTNPDALNRVGVAIELQPGDSRKINEMISYLHPVQMSPDAKTLTDELITHTRDLEGAGNSATGQVDPNRASGSAIIAARDMAMIPLNEQIANYRQFVEDLAHMWFDIWAAYYPNGLDVPMKPEGQDGAEVIGRIEPEVLQNLKVSVRVDVNEVDRTTRFGMVQIMQSLFEKNRIDFAEFVESLEDDSFLPKTKLETIVRKREEKQREQENSLLAQSMELNRQYEMMLNGTPAPEPETQPGGGGMSVVSPVPDGNVY